MATKNPGPDQDVRDRIKQTISNRDTGDGVKRSTVEAVAVVTENVGITHASGHIDALIRDGEIYDVDDRLKRTAVEQNTPTTNAETTHLAEGTLSTVLAAVDAHDYGNGAPFEQFSRVLSWDDETVLEALITLEARGELERVGVAEFTNHDTGDTYRVCVST